MRVRCPVEEKHRVHEGISPECWAEPGLPEHAIDSPEVVTKENFGKFFFHLNWKYNMMNAVSNAKLTVFMKAAADIVLRRTFLFEIFGTTITLKVVDLMDVETSHISEK